MTIAIKECKILEEIQASDKTVIYRGYCDAWQNSVIIKLLKSEYSNLEEVTRFRQEYDITRQINCQGVVKAYNLEKHQKGLALILEDFGGQSLKQVIAFQTLQLRQILQIVIVLAETLHELHQKHIIHKDIKPSNIIINLATELVKITDFSIATRLDRETLIIGNPNLLEGTLAYMSPEQTGRMNRSIDYRTDFYSLGVTFYEMLTGRLPFISTDPMELVHCHIAKKPIPPTEVNPKIPQAVSDIVMKLLAKTAEERYQTAFGLKADLEICLSQLETTGKIDNFPIGERDKSGQLLIPQKLYGREIEVTTVMEAFQRVSNGTTEMMLVAGFSGIGKTSVVNEVHKPIVAAKGYFIAGKFDQYKRNIPYYSLIQAFQSLMRQLLTESSERIEIWQQEILNAVGANGQVIIDVIPEVELIVGKQPPVAQLGPTESQNRFNRVFQQFIRVFCQKEHPLVLFLDDLQWADSASFKLIELIVTDPDSKYLLLIGAYRDNEVSATHPLMLTLEEIQKNGAIVNTITLGCLKIETVNHLIAETLYSDPNKVKQLSSLVLNKTAGNPFFLTQLLKSLHSEKLITYNVGTGCWEWDIEVLQAVGMTENVVELMVKQIQKLPIITQDVLKLAACIGNQFNLDILTIVNEKSISVTATELWPALQQSLVLPLNSEYKIPLVFDPDDLAKAASELQVNYKFLHDRVQQAAYALIPEDKKKEVHLKVGQLLLNNTDENTQLENLFDIVNHLNISADLIASQEQKNQLATLNLTAGRRAKAATAYEAALRYFNLGIELLAADSWETQYDLTLALYVEAVEAEYLNTNFEQAETLGDVVLQKATTLLDRAKVYELKINMYASEFQMAKAFNTGLQALEMMGVSLSNALSDGSQKVTLPRLEDLENIPEMTDPYKLAAMRLLQALTAPAFQANPDILPRLMFTQVNLCIEHGHSGLAAFTYSWYGLLLCGAMGDIESGYHSGSIAMKLLEKFNARQLKCTVINMFNVFIKPWKSHIRETLAPLMEALQIGLEVGDMVYASYSAANYCAYLFTVEERLDEVAYKQAPLIYLLAKLKNQISINLANIWRQATFNLRGLAADKYLLIGENFDETVIVPKLYASNDCFSLFNVHLAKSILFYLLKNSAEAVATASIAEEYLESVNGLIFVATHKFYYSLALLAQYPNASPEEQEKFIKQVEKNQEKMQLWAYHAPMNYQHKYDLVEAEKARVLGQNWEASEFYEKAIAGAREHGYIQEEALAYELAAEFYQAKGRRQIAETYIIKAHNCYLRWGAKAKVEDLDSRYSDLFNRTQSPETKSIQIKTTASTTGANARVFDLSTVIKASLALAGEIVLEKLLNKLMKIVIENAGAQTGLLILQKDEQLVIEAAGSVNSDEVLLLQSTPVASSNSVPASILNYVSRVREDVVLNDASKEGIFTADTYIVEKHPKSVLCTPLVHQGKLIGLLYLENNLTTGAFTTDRLEVLKILSSQVAISLENACLYANLSAAGESLKKANEQLEEYSRTLEAKVEERTLELKEKNKRLKEQAKELKQALKELKNTQTQLIQTEKMSSLGQMVAGVAHEINNPVNFIYGNLSHTDDYIQNLLHLLDVYQQEYPNPTEKIITATEESELEFLKEDLPKMLSSMKIGASRIRQIVLSLRNFSRLDEAEMKPVDIHEGIDSTLLILQHRLKQTTEHPAIEIIKEYEQLPLVECYAGQLNQVFMNILANAIDALQANSKLESSFQPSISICTKLINSINASPSINTALQKGTSCDRQLGVAIIIADNGLGMTEQVRKRVFDPFYTTKPVGKGTGLGLSISYSIIVEKHGGSLSCVSAPGEGAEFIIEIPVKQGR